MPVQFHHQNYKLLHAHDDNFQGNHLAKPQLMEQNATFITPKSIFLPHKAQQGFPLGGYVR